MKLKYKVFLAALASIVPLVFFALYFIKTITQQRLSDLLAAGVNDQIMEQHLALTDVIRSMMYFWEQGVILFIGVLFLLFAFRKSGVKRIIISFSAFFCITLVGAALFSIFLRENPWQAAYTFQGILQRYTFIVLALLGAILLFTNGKKLVSDRQQCAVVLGLLPLFTMALAFPYILGWQNFAEKQWGAIFTSILAVGLVLALFAIIFAGLIIYRSGKTGKYIPTLPLVLLAAVELAIIVLCITALSEHFPSLINFVGGGEKLNMLEVTHNVHQYVWSAVLVASFVTFISGVFKLVVPLTDKKMGNKHLFYVTAQIALAVLAVITLVLFSNYCLIIAELLLLIALALRSKPAFAV